MNTTTAKTCRHSTNPRAITMNACPHVSGVSECGGCFDCGAKYVTFPVGYVTTRDGSRRWSNGGAAWVSAHEIP